MGSAPYYLRVDCATLFSLPSLSFLRSSALYKVRPIVYNSVTGDRCCKIRDQTKGQRGSNVIGALMYLYLQEYLPADVKNVVITSENRNEFVMQCYS